MQQQIDQLFYLWKLKNLEHPDNGTKNDGNSRWLHEVGEFLDRYGRGKDGP